ncbi:MAG: AmmeMemoRadiSam system protein B [Gammaproteobacteria bacterium]
MNNRTGTVRAPAVAGMFYPAQAQALCSMVDDLLHDSALEDESATCPKALIVPHAGYVYSGAVAAAAYAQLRPHRELIRRVVLLGPAHRVAFQGLATSTAAAWHTPLGDVPLDTQAATGLAALPQVHALDRAHADEHSLEVQLPFLQRALDTFTLLPLVVGEASPGEVAEVLERFWYDEHTLFVISSDLSHYLDYDTCQRVDHVTCQAIETLAGDLIGNEQACGRYPVRGLLLTARRHHLTPVTLKLCNSGDTAGDKRRVVGYGAWAFYPAAA